ncbi:anti-sigma factor [Chloroflexi bacterium TSY]|nr:anti-sigma factor [Chloroflexi bacterium TSY]
MSLNGAQPVWSPQVEQYDHQSSRVRRLLTARSLVNMLAVISLIALIVVGIIELQHFSQLRTALAVNAVIYEQIDVVKARNEELESLNEEVSLQNLILQANRAEYAHANLELADELARKHEELAVSRERIDRLVRAERAEILSGTEGTSELQGIFYLNDAQGTLIVRGLQPLSTDQTYQFWLSLPDGNQIPASLVSVQSAQEPSWTEITLPASVPQFAGVGITIEPAGGSQQPTGPMLLASEVS